MTTPVADEPSLGPEELLLGPRARRQPPWPPITALIITVVIVTVLVVVVVALWRFWPRPDAPLSLAELEDTYAGMVRSDGTNDASVLTRQSVAETPVAVVPTECAPLVQATLANRIPDAALDGVGTYWFGQDSTISLFTMRFPDAVAVDAERSRIEAAVDACAGRQILVRRDPDSGIRASRATVSRVGDTSVADGSFGYLLTGPDGLLAIQLMPFMNTLTWQFRYETGSATYSPLSADRLMRSLRLQLEEVVAARPQ